MSVSGYFEITIPRSDNDDPAVESSTSPWLGHARLEWRPEGVTITDLGGQQPLAVNGQPLQAHQPAVLSPGDTIQLAGAQLAWQSVEPTPAPLEAQFAPVEYFLTVKTPGWTRELSLKGSAATLGRGEDNDLIINEKGVSRHHARLEEKAGGYEIIDLGSTFGLRIQDRPFARKMLVDGDQIQIADDVSLTVRVTGARVEPPAAPPQPAQGATVLIPRQQAPAQPASAAPSDAPQPPEAGPPGGKTVIVPREPAPTPTGSARPAPPSAGQTSLVDMPQYLETATPGGATQVSGLWQTSAPHLVIHLLGRTWQALFSKEHLTIGRDDDNDIVIPDSSISHNHATVTRKGDDFIIRDSNSGNGVWLGKLRIQSHKLRQGDVISLGRAKIIFKGGFSQNDLTLIGPPTIDGRRTRRPVIFVPGLGGSELWLGSERLFPAPKVLISNPEKLSLPGDPRIEARQIVSDVVVIPGVLKQEQYSRLGDYLESGLGYTRGKDLLEFAYDWRQDVRLAAQRLAETIDQWRPGAPVTIIAHSLGTLVTRYYIEKLGGKRVTERIVLMGGPHYGTPKAILVILVGPGILPFGLGDERIRRVMAQYPSAYQILPIYPCVFDQYGRQIDVLTDETWLPEDQRPYLRIARSFRRELGYRSSVPAVSIFGYGYKTAVRLRIERRPEGGWQRVDFVDEIAGDLSIPAGSAVLKNSEIHPVYQEHGALYVDNDVKMRLKVELTRSTTLQGKKI